MPSTIIITCEHCNKQSTKLLKNYKRSKHHYCSRSCANMGSPRRKPEGKCKVCSTPIPLRREHCDNCSNNTRPKYKSQPGTKMYWKGRLLTFREFLKEYKLYHGCTDCGYNSHHAGLEFDHLPEFEKTGGVASLYRRTQESIMEEINKCEVVCGTCHNIRTYTRKFGGQ